MQRVYRITRGIGVLQAPKRPYNTMGFRYEQPSSNYHHPITAAAVLSYAEIMTRKSRRLRLPDSRPDDQVYKHFEKLLDDQENRMLDIMNKNLENLLLFVCSSKLSCVRW